MRPIVQTEKCMDVSVRQRCYFERRGNMAGRLAFKEITLLILMSLRNIGASKLLALSNIPYLANMTGCWFKS